MEMELLQYLFPAAMLCAAAGFLVWRSHLGRRGAMSPVVRDLLRRATERGAYMTLEFEEQGHDAESLLGPCLDFDQHTVWIDIGRGRNRPEWEGASIHVSFQLNDLKATTYHQFTSLVRGTTRRDGVLCLLLHTPEEIPSGQKRQFVRILPLQDAVLELDAWIYERDAPRPLFKSELGNDELCRHLGREGSLALADISAAGLRLSLRRKPDAPPLDLDAGARLLCLLTLNPVKKDALLPFWLDCTVMNMLVREKSNLIGLNFDAWAVVGEEPGKEFVEWSPTGENGWISLLGTWVWHQQLAKVALRSRDE